MAMTPEAKRALSGTIRGLRERLLADLHAAIESAYRLSVRPRDAGLSEARRVQRQRLEAWSDEQVRADRARDAEAFRLEVEKQAAYTLLNRVVILRLMEATGLREPAVVTGAWESRAYKDFRQLSPALVRGDESEGYAYLLRLVFEDLATDLPGIFGPAGVADLVPVPAATLRHLVEALDSPELSPCWTDDMTLGWVYQYWNDPEREALDAKLNSGGKVEPHEIASKTQMFTERYLVDWLLQNSLGPMWLAMCKKHGWAPEVEADGTLERLEAHRVNWREKRERGEAALTELMPLETDAERRWAYYLPQPVPDDAMEQAPNSVRDIKILDPALGSGHFLVVAFDLLVPLYREEARHRGVEGEVEWKERAIVERILEHNLHGIDLDPRAVQIAAAALWLKARQTCPEARPRSLNLVASALHLGSLPNDDPALMDLRKEVERETGIPAKLTNKVMEALEGADHLGSLLRVDEAVDQTLRDHESDLTQEARPSQGELFGGFAAQQVRIPVKPAEARESILARLERFLSRHTGGDDLGLRLRGQQLAAGVRFVRMVREGTYDLVVGNPPYQGTSKMADAAFVKKHYPKGKADLYAAFLERGLQFARSGGTSALLTMRNWMFIKQYSDIRMWLLETYDLRALGDFDRGAFEEVPDEVVSVVVSVFRKAGVKEKESLALQPTLRDDRSRDSERTRRKRAAVLCGVGRQDFKPVALKVVPEWPLVYWWEKAFVARYSKTLKLGELSPVRQGMATADNTRFLRSPWEVRYGEVFQTRVDGEMAGLCWLGNWVPYIKGAEGRSWLEPMSEVVKWQPNGLEIKLQERDGKQTSRPQNEQYYFRKGIAFSSTGAICRARIHRFRSVFDVKGQSAFPPNPEQICCVMNSAIGRFVLESLNPSISFQVGDALRLPAFAFADSKDVFRALNGAFEQHEHNREPAIEFRHPGPSPWRHAQKWAQAAVDRPEGAPLPPYEPEYDTEPSTDHISFALGVALGRFGENGEGILDPAKEDISGTLPAGICFLDGTLDRDDLRDSLGHNAARLLHKTWAGRGGEIDAGTDLRTYLRLKFFGDVHRQMYENRPIHWPLSSAKKTFVAWVNIHRFADATLRVLQADHLHPTLARLDGELDDLRATRDGADNKVARIADRRHGEVKKAREELAEFISAVEQCAEKGPPLSNGKCPPRAADARYNPDLDDGVMINSAALWPLLQYQWSKPKQWWKELASSKGKKDYDWAHLAMRYWPDRVDKKCQEDPSLGVAHGCFWRYHPARAWSWELRLQDEIGPDFRIEEAPYRGDDGSKAHRAAFLADHPEEALEIVEKEVLRRKRKQKSPQAELRLLETGLWSRVPDLCWALEERIIKKQKASFHLLSPDEPAARATFMGADPERARSRRSLLGAQAESGKMFNGNDDGRGGE